MKQTSQLILATSIKKLILATVAFLSVSAFTFAQTTTQAPASAKSTSRKQTTNVQKTDAGKTKVSTSQKTVTQKDAGQQPSSTTKSSTSSTNNGVALKKDGTPDMRLKENKDAKKPVVAAGPVKKDGTPDMRYKSNKAPEKKK